MAPSATIEANTCGHKPGGMLRTVVVATVGTTAAAAGESNSRHRP